MKSKPYSLFCPFCNSKGSKQPVLSPMTVNQVKATPLDSGHGQPAPTPYFLYKCERCGFCEIHENKVGEAA